MKKLLSLLLAGALLFLAACAPKQAENAGASSLPAQIVPPAGGEASAADASGEDGGTGSQERLLWPTVPAPSLAGNLIGEETQQSIGLCLPPSYYAGGDEEKSYPVLYFLTGYTEDYTVRTETFYASLERLYTQELIGEMIVVVVNGANRFGGSWYANSPVSGNWQDYVVQDVVGYIDANYRTLPAAESRCLAGHSMGGAGVLHISMQRPGVFAHAYAMSPAVFANEDFAAFAVSYEVLELVAQNYAGQSPEDAAQNYIADIATMPTAYFWSLGYASAFAPAPEALPPYVALPPKLANGAWAEEGKVQASYLQGAGNLDRKVRAHAEALRQLQSFSIDYGTNDENSWLPPGCEYLAQQLQVQDIPYLLMPYEGGHNDQVDARIEQIVLPYFWSALAG